MNRILAVVPWPIYVVVMLAIAVLIIARNSYKLRTELGKALGLDEMSDCYPRAKIFWRPKK